MRWVCSKKIILFTRGWVGKLGVCPKLFCLSSFNIRFAYKVLTSSFVAWINGRRRSLAMAIRARVCSLLVAFPKVPLTFTFTYFSSLAMAIHARVWSLRILVPKVPLTFTVYIHLLNSISTFTYFSSLEMAIAGAQVCSLHIRLFFDFHFSHSPLTFTF